MAQAMGYLLNQWDALGVYTTQCFLSIDNNAAARALKRVVIGRKNSLFAGNDPAAQRRRSSIHSSPVPSVTASIRISSHENTGEDQHQAG
jgi:hypothetical protein